MSTVPKIIDCIISDDFRREFGNKISLIGIYYKDLIVPAVPFNIPQLCFTLRLDLTKSTAKKFALKIKMPSGDILGPLKADVPKPSDGVRKTMSLSVFPVEITKTGTCEVYISFDGKRESRIGQLEVKLSAPK